MADQPNGVYSTIPHSQPALPDKTRNRQIWENWQTGQDSRLGTRTGTAKFLNNNVPYDIYKRGPGQQEELHVTGKGPDDFSFRYYRPGEDPRGQPHVEYYPGGEQLRDANNYLAEHPNNPWDNNPWHDVNGKQISAGTATIPQLNMINEQLQSFARPEMPQADQNRIIAQYRAALAMAGPKGTNSVRELLQSIDPNDLTTFAQTLRKSGVDWLGMSRSQLEKAFPQYGDTIAKVSRLQTTLEGLANQGVILSGMKTGSSSDLPSHVSNVLDDFGLITETPGAAAVAGAVKGVGSLIGALTDPKGKINQEKLRDGVGPEAARIFQGINTEVSNASTSHRFNNDVADAGTDSGNQATTLGVGKNDSYEKAGYTGYEGGTKQQQPSDQTVTPTSTPRPTPGVKEMSTAGSASNVGSAIQKGVQGIESLAGVKPLPKEEQSAEVNAAQAKKEGEYNPKATASVSALPGKIGEAATDAGEAFRRTPIAKASATLSAPFDYLGNAVVGGIRNLFTPGDVDNPSFTAPPAVGVPKEPATSEPGYGAAQKALEERLKVPPAPITPEVPLNKPAPPNKPAFNPWGILQPLFGQNDQLPSDAAVGAPLGSPDNPIVHQEHVDALAPGTPFHWRDHPNPYVKV